MEKERKTSFESSAKWYDETVSNTGHYYHEHVIFPKLLELMELDKHSKVLDLACGQGVLARKIPQEVPYVGVDISDSLIRFAKERSKRKNHQFFQQDLTEKMSLKTKDFSHGVIILALQNIENPLEVLKNAQQHLMTTGNLFIVLNHPCFRIPRQSHWGVDSEKKSQYRRLDRYLSPLKIPITTHPGKKESPNTWSFHSPLSTYSKWLKESGFFISELHEWVSDKKSSGPKARMENRAREEFPLFLTIVAEKK